MIRATARLKAIGEGGVMLYLPAHVRDALGMTAGDHVVIDVVEGKMTVSRDWFK